MTSIIKWSIAIGFIFGMFILLSNIFLSDFMCSLKIFSMSVMRSSKLFMDVFFPFTAASIRILVVFMFLKWIIKDLIIENISGSATSQTTETTS